MSTDFQKPTDEVHKVDLASKIVHALWVSRTVCAGDKARFEVWTHFVGNGADIQVTVMDKKGKTIAKIKDQVLGNYFSGTVEVPENAKEALGFTANLPKHNLEKKSDACWIHQPFVIDDQKWGQKEARRGDLVKLSAKTQNLADATEVMILIYEYDQDKAHDFITKFPCRVKNNTIEAEWKYEYHEDTDDIPHDAEMKQHGNQYRYPEYFWVADLHGRRFGDKQESGLLKFKDWIEIELVDYYGNPVDGAEYTILLPDGSKQKGKLDSSGYARVDDMPPGKIDVEFPKQPYLYGNFDSDADADER
jgi:hypothetical protein